MDTDIAKGATPNQVEPSSVEPSSVEPFTMRLRERKQRTADALQITAKTAGGALANALTVKHLPQDSEPMLEWSDATQLAVLDIDYHDMPYDSRPSSSRLAAIVSQIEPQPVAWHESHGRGAKLYYVAKCGLMADELAATGATQWLSIDPFATCEVAARSRHPCYNRGDKWIPQPPEWCAPNANLSRWFAAWAGIPTAPGEDSEHDAEWVTWCDCHGYTVGRQHAHGLCPIDPDHVSKSNPVSVSDAGIHCFSCDARGLTYRGRNGKPGWVPRRQLLRADADGGNDAPRADSLMFALVKRIAPLDVVRRLGSRSIRHAHLLAPLYSAAVCWYHVNCLGADLATVRERIRRAMQPVRRVRNYSDDSPIHKREASKDATDGRGTANASTLPDEITLSKPTSTGTVTIEASRDGKPLSHLRNRRQLGSAKTRAELAPQYGITQGQFAYMLSAMGDEKTFKVSDLPPDSPGVKDATEFAQCLPLNVNEIADAIFAAVGGNLYHIPGGLFAVEVRECSATTPEAGHENGTGAEKHHRREMVTIGNADDLHAFVARTVKSSVHPIDWQNGPEYATWGDAFTAVEQIAPRYDGVFPTPRHPAVSTMFELESAPKRPDVATAHGFGPGVALGRFLRLFNPASDTDRVLLRAMLLTLFWGGPPGSRPIFLLTASEDESGGGRGVGKTTVAEQFGQLAGGVVSFNMGTSVDTLGTRLVSPEAAGKWVVLWDNVKSDRLSNGDFEGLVTADTLSCRKLYAGEGRRPNYFTYILTMNGGAMSKDFAKRTVVIRMARPDAYGASWKAQIAEFLNPAGWRRTALLADIVDALKLAETRTTRGAGHEPWDAGKTRWAKWEAGVLAGCVADEAELDAVVNELTARQDEADADTTDAEFLRGALRSFIRREHKVSEADTDAGVFELSADSIVSAVRATTQSQSYSDRSPTKALSEVGRHIGEIPELVKRRGSKGVTYFWIGDAVEHSAELRKTADAGQIRKAMRAIIADATQSKGKPQGIASRGLTPVG